MFAFADRHHQHASHKCSYSVTGPHPSAAGRYGVNISKGSRIDCGERVSLQVMLAGGCRVCSLTATAWHQSDMHTSCNIVRKRLLDGAGAFHGFLQ
jgi:hypothetical protein